MAAHLPASDEDQESPLISTGFMLRLTAAIAAIAFLTALISVGGQWFGARIALAGHTESTAPVSVEIGQDRLAIPANTIRFPDQRRNGPTERLDLYVTWPQMQGYSRAERLRFDDVSIPSSLIFLQMSEGTMSRDMSGRLQPIYSKLFEGKPEQGPFGLTLHHLRKDSGYGSEVVLTGPAKAPTPMSCAASCRPPERPQPAATASATCSSATIFRSSTDSLPASSATGSGSTTAFTLSSRHTSPRVCKRPKKPGKTSIKCGPRRQPAVHHKRLGNAIPLHCLATVARGRRPEVITIIMQKR